MPTIAANTYIGSLMAGFTTEATEGNWVHYITSALAIVATVLTVRYLMKYFKVMLASRNFASDV